MTQMKQAVPTFQQSTRLKYVNVTTLTKPVGGGITQIDIPKSGLLHRLYLRISVTTAGALSVLNPYGISAAIRRVRLTLNSGIDLINISGPGYHWLLRDMVDNFLDVSAQSTARNAILTATTYNLDMVLPVSLNAKDAIGLVMLQNEETLATLVIDWESDANLATGMTLTGTCTPMMAVFEVPQDPRSYPDLSVLQQIIEDSVAVPAGADYTYNWQRGATYLGTYHLMQANGFTRAVLRAQQSMILADLDAGRMVALQNSINERDLTLSGGAITGSDKRIFWDFSGTDGLGMFGVGRDVIDSSRLTDLATVITPAGVATLTTVRRQLIRVRG